MEPVFKARGYLILAALFLAFCVRSAIGGGLFPWLVTYTLITTLGDVLITRRYKMRLNTMLHDGLPESIRKNNSFDATHMETFVNQTIDDSAGVQKTIPFQDRFGLTAEQMNAHFETVCTLRLWSFAIATIHCIAAFFVHLNYEKMFINTYFLVRISCFLYRITLRALKRPQLA